MRITDCTLAYGDNPDRLCTWCGEPLTGRRRRWCSDACGEEFGRNHWWGTARDAALSRDGYQCQWCSTVGWVDMPFQLQQELGFVTEDVVTPYPAGEVDVAAAFGIVDRVDRDWYRQPVDPYGAPHDWMRASRVRHRASEGLPESWTMLVSRERNAAVRLRRKGRRGHVLEVDHIEAAEGRHSKTDCVHHLDNLRTLCRECHRRRTAEQRRGRRVDERPVLATQGRLL